MRQILQMESNRRNLLPQNGSPLASSGIEDNMSPLAEFDRKMEEMIRELTLHIVVPNWSEFDTVWESANKICDRYDLKKAA